MGSPEDETVAGLGLAARLRPAGGKALIIAAAGEDRQVQLMSDGIDRDALVSLVEAALAMPLAP